MSGGAGVRLQDRRSGEEEEGEEGGGGGVLDETESLGWCLSLHLIVAH